MFAQEPIVIPGRILLNVYDSSRSCQVEPWPFHTEIDTEYRYFRWNLLNFLWQTSGEEDEDTQSYQQSQRPIKRKIKAEDESVSSSSNRKKMNINTTNKKQ